MEFNYFLPVNIVFGSGKVLETGELTRPYGKKALIAVSYTHLPCLYITVGSPSRRL